VNFFWISELFLASKVESVQFEFTLLSAVQPNTSTGVYALMATVHSLQARHDGIVALYNDNEAIVRSIQQEALTDLLPLLEQELALDEAGILQAKSFILDRGMFPYPPLETPSDELELPRRSHRLPILSTSSLLHPRRTQPPSCNAHVPTFPPSTVRQERIPPRAVPLGTLVLLPPLSHRQVRTTLWGTQPAPRQSYRGWRARWIEGVCQARVGGREEVVDGTEQAEGGGSQGADGPHRRFGWCRHVQSCQSGHIMWVELQLTRSARIGS
jgi:hypothetical protein